MKDAIEVVRRHDPDDRAAIVDALVAFNRAQVPAEARLPLAVLIRAQADGRVIGGLWGRFTYEWLFVELLVVPEAMRGQGIGRAIVARAEAVARAEGCVGIWLDSFDFQAVGFYEALGFTACGAIEDHPPGHRRVFLHKRLDGAAPPGTRDPERRARPRPAAHGAGRQTRS